MALLSDQRDELKEHITNDIVMDRIQNKLNEDEMEKEEQEKRRKSVIVFGLKESCSTDAEVSNAGLWLRHSRQMPTQLNSLNSTGDYGRRCLTPLCPHH